MLNARENMCIALFEKAAYNKFYSESASFLGPRFQFYFTLIFLFTL